MRKATPFLLLSLLLVWAILQAAEAHRLARDTRALAADMDALRGQQAALWTKLDDCRAEHSRTIYEPPEPTFTPDPDIPLSDELQEHVHNEARRIGIDPAILYRIMWRESRYQTDVVGYNANGTTDHGLMQINSSTHDFLAERGIDWTSPEGNVTAACELIRYYRDERGYSLLEALACYGSGEQGFRRGEGIEAAKHLMEVTHHQQQ